MNVGFYMVNAKKLILCWDEKFPPNNTLHKMPDIELFGL